MTKTSSSKAHFTATPVQSIAQAEAQLVAAWVAADPEASNTIRAIYENYNSTDSAWRVVVKTAQFTLAVR